jgi:hypothetical protein
MSLKIGSGTVNALYVGASAVDKVYLGASLVDTGGGGGVDAANALQLDGATLQLGGQDLTLGA